MYGLVALIFFALTIFAGYALAIRLRSHLTWMEAAAASPVIGIIPATWVALVVYLFTGSLDISILLTTLLMIAAIIYLKPWTDRPAPEKKHLPAFLLILAASAILMYQGLLTYYGGEYHIAFPFYGDAAFHTSIITSFSQGSNYLPQYPIMSGHLLRYTFLIDFYSALLDRLGSGIQWSVVLPGISLMTSLFYLIYSLGCRFTGRVAGGLITASVVAFSGGLQFIQAFKDWSTSGQPIMTFLTTNNLNYTCVFDLNYVFTNFLIIIMAQRAALIGFAVGALIILISYTQYLEKNKDGKSGRMTLLVIGVLAGLLPLLHTYSYACVMISMVFLFILYRERQWYYFMLPAIILALPQAVYITGQGAQSLIRVQLGWMAGSLTDIPGFWIMNMGLELFLLIAGLLIAGKKKAMFYLPYLAIFIVANVIVFQAWDYDNHKMFSFWLMPSALFIAVALLRIYDFRVAGKPLFALVFALTILTGALVAFFIVSQPYVEFSKNDIYVADWVMQNTPPDAVFLTGDAPTHPVIALAGRLSYLGYYPWMYTHGVDTNDRVQTVRSIYNAESMHAMIERLKEQNISYVHLGPQELRSQMYHVNQSLFEYWEPVFDWTAPNGEQYRIYRVE
ncbi:conserved hypothetical protein [Methanocella arvoryzae MRE50]|uniref:Glycosyltransferase RgtA/B/C/D-like domain-containing protein n=1 Tax=Methanocella arvoryzae (strain DSM 22066 / NBRC 105507 / MRE50) TaxID=351160 RepID=Q0W0G3_METAR|nr:conserved hypothetical protein [Methanocella arvoryzae MRE50]